MLFNLDKNLKHSILEEYRKEALLHKEKKQLQKQQKIKEELEKMGIEGSIDMVKVLESIRY